MLLPGRLASRTLADRHQVGPLVCVIQDRARGKVVIQHDVGRAQARCRLQRQEFRIARTGRDKGDEAAHLSSAIRWKNVPVA